MLRSPTTAFAAGHGVRPRGGITAAMGSLVFRYPPTALTPERGARQQRSTTAAVGRKQTPLTDQRPRRLDYTAELSGSSTYQAAAHLNGVPEQCATAAAAVSPAAAEAAAAGSSQRLRGQGQVPSIQHSLSRPTLRGKAVAPTRAAALTTSAAAGFSHTTWGQGQVPPFHHSHSLSGPTVPGTTAPTTRTAGRTASAAAVPEPAATAGSDGQMTAVDDGRMTVFEYVMAFRLRDGCSEEQGVTALEALWSKQFSVRGCLYAAGAAVTPSLGHNNGAPNRCPSIEPHDCATKHIPSRLFKRMFAGVGQNVCMSRLFA